MPVPDDGLTDSRHFVRSSQVGVLGMGHQHPVGQATLRQGPEWTTPCIVPTQKTLGARLRPTQKQARQVLRNGNALNQYLQPQSGNEGRGEAATSSRVRSPGNGSWIQVMECCSDPLQPRSTSAKPTWRTLNSSLGRLGTGSGDPPERVPGAMGHWSLVATPRASNTPGKDPTGVGEPAPRYKDSLRAVGEKGADESPLKPSGATRHGGGCCSPSPDQTGGLASSFKRLGARPPHDHKGEREKAQIPPPCGDRAGEAALGAVAVHGSRVGERDVMRWKAAENDTAKQTRGGEGGEKTGQPSDAEHVEEMFWQSVEELESEKRTSER